MEDFSEKVRRDDILTFINACLACTGQSEFYESEYVQTVNIDFLHQYILKNYRNLYADFLAIDINDFNKSTIIFNLLSTGKEINENYKNQENKLIEYGLKTLAPQRVYKLFKKLRDKRVNNRRTRSTIKKYLENKKDISFEAVKYRTKFRKAVKHIHLKTDSETSEFLFKGWKTNHNYENALYQSFKKAHYSKESIYELPFTIAEGLAVKWKIKREIFLEKIIPQMSFTEKYRLQNRYKDLKITDLDINYEKMSITKNALYILSLPESEKHEKLEFLEQIMTSSAKNFINKTNLKFNNVVAILDRSYSSSGSTEKRRRPLAISMAVHYLLKNCSENYKALWTYPTESEVLLNPKGATNIAELLVEAISYQPELIIIVSDGYENAPFEGTKEVMRIFNKKLFSHIKFIHLNPVFSSIDYLPKTISDLIPTLNIRDAENIEFLTNFADYSDNKISLSQLENYFSQKVGKLL